jgi:hypothetical protein
LIGSDVDHLDRLGRGDGDLFLTARGARQQCEGGGEAEQHAHADGAVAPRWRGEGGIWLAAPRARGLLAGKLEWITW